MKKFLILIGLSALSLSINAQSIERFVIGSAGGSYNDGTTYVDYTSGETAISTISNANNFLTQGFQQPFTNTYVSVPEVNLSENGMRVFPNPVTDLLNLQFTVENEAKARIMLMDGLGKLLIDESITVNDQTTHTLDLSRFATGQYYLRVYLDKTFFQGEKILKINQ